MSEAAATAAPPPSASTAFSRFRRNPISVGALIVVAILAILVVLGPSIVPYPAVVAGGVDTANQFLPPSAAHWFGTNELGQDVLSLVVAGTRTSLVAALSVILLSALIGSIVGALAGFFGGWLDEILMRLTDLMLTVPSLILAMAVAAALGHGLFNVVLAITLATWPGYARLVRGEVRARREEIYVVAAKALGARWPRLLLRHIAPNVLPTIVVKMSLEVSFSILTVASLGFIGIGVAPPTPEWGTLLSTARGYMPDDWWIAIFPGLAILIAVFAFNLLGDGLRDALDPRGRR